jgi:hypothetical protein
MCGQRGGAKSTTSEQATKQQEEEEEGEDGSCPKIKNILHIFTWRIQINEHIYLSFKYWLLISCNYPSICDSLIDACMV